MDYPTLDDTIKKAVTELNLEEAGISALEETRVARLRCEDNEGYTHEILWYGVEAVAHTHLMRRARDISNEKLSVEEFVAKYGLNFNGIVEGFDVLLSKIESEGIFIPQQAYCIRGSDRKKRNRIISIFSGDYINRIRSDSWVDKEYALQLIKKPKWQPTDLENSVLVEQGVQFGKDMFQTCVDGFEWYINWRTEQGNPQLSKVTDVGRKLLAYYDSIVNLPDHQ